MNDCGGSTLIAQVQSSPRTLLHVSEPSFTRITVPRTEYIQRESDIHHNIALSRRDGLRRTRWRHPRACEARQRSPKSQNSPPRFVRVCCYTIQLGSMIHSGYRRDNSRLVLCYPRQGYHNPKVLELLFSLQPEKQVSERRSAAAWEMVKSQAVWNTMFGRQKSLLGSSINPADGVFLQQSRKGSG